MNSNKFKICKCKDPRFRFKKKKCKWMGSTQTIFRESSVQDLHRIFAVHLLKKSIFYWTGRTAYQQFKFMHSFWNHRGGVGWGGAARANQSLYAYLLQHFAMLWCVILIICYGIFMQSYEICMLWYSMLCYALRFE